MQDQEDAMERWKQSQSPVGLRCAPLVLTALFVVSVGAGVPARAQTFTILHNFTGGSDGTVPQAGLSMDRGGNLYGTASEGGNLQQCGGSGCGTVFKLTHKNSGWILSTLYEFTGRDGQTPQSRVIFGPDGNLYGTTTSGGASRMGTVFRLQPPATFCRAVSCPWTETVLYSFRGGNDGANPTYGDLAFDRAGNIYGTTPFGGTGNSGTVFELTPSGQSWSETVIHSFNGSDGFEPYAGVILDSAGNLYGTTSGGQGGGGNAYELTQSDTGWTISTIYDFPFPGGAYGGLVFDASGNLYGITAFTPTVYKLSPSSGGWTYEALYTFQAYGALAQLSMDAGGNLYGTLLLGTSEVFRLTRSGDVWTLTGFNGSAGEQPSSNVIVDGNGNLYATAAYDCVFEITP